MNVISLFSGCGGLDIGFEGGFTCLKQSIVNQAWIAENHGKQIKVIPTGFHTVFANDIRPDAKIAWVNYFKPATDIYHEGSIVDLVKRAHAGEKVFPDNIDIVTGGFPCQDFSVAGKRKGFNSEKSHTGVVRTNLEPASESRGQLYKWMREVIILTKPSMFIAENVKGLTNLANVKEIIEQDFASAGYLVVPARVLRAMDYGVPQSRERVFFYGFKKEALKEEALLELSKSKISPEYDPYPPATHVNTPVTCSVAFTGLEEPENSSDISQQKYSKAKYMGRHCQGQTEINLNSVSPTIRSEHHGNIEYRRLSAEHGGTHKSELAQGLLERRLTVRECARIQTFPDEYQFILPKVSSSDAYKLIGNAVPCILAYNIAMRISEQWHKYFL